MHAVLTTNQQAIEDACRRFGVEHLEAFGSVTGADFDPDRSDVDFLVVFAPTSAVEHADRYFGLLESLEQLTGRHVDLVELDAIRNPYFLRGVEATRTVVFTA